MTEPERSNTLAIDDRDYRRGFHHGVINVLEAIERLENPTRERILAYLYAYNDKVDSWRYSEPDDQEIPPPA